MLLATPELFLFLCEDGIALCCPIPRNFMLLFAFLLLVVFQLLSGWVQIGCYPWRQHGTMLIGMGSKKHVEDPISTRLFVSWFMGFREEISIIKVQKLNRSAVLFMQSRSLLDIAQGVEDFSGIGFFAYIAHKI